MSLPRINRKYFPQRSGASYLRDSKNWVSVLCAYALKFQEVLKPSSKFACSRCMILTMWNLFLSHVGPRDRHKRDAEVPDFSLHKRKSKFLHLPYSGECLGYLGPTYCPGNVAKSVHMIGKYQTQESLWYGLGTYQFLRDRGSIQGLVVKHCEKCCIVCGVPNYVVLHYEKIDGSHGYTVSWRSTFERCLDYWLLRACASGRSEWEHFENRILHFSRPLFFWLLARGYLQLRCFYAHLSTSRPK